MKNKDPEDDSQVVIRLQVTFPRWLRWMLAGALIGNVHNLGDLLIMLGRLLRKNSPRGQSESRWRQILLA